MRTRTPPRTKERYILDSIPKIFKGGEWIEVARENAPLPSQNEKSQMGGEGVSGRENGSTHAAGDSTSSRYITIIGGQKYDKDVLSYHLTFDADFDAVVVGDGRGVESDIRSDSEAVLHIKVDPDLYGKNARKVNVEQVLSFAPESPLLLVGEGERVKQARAWLKRARWPREVIDLP